MKSLLKLIIKIAVYTIAVVFIISLCAINLFFSLIIVFYLLYKNNKRKRSNNSLKGRIAENNLIDKNNIEVKSIKKSNYNSDYLSVGKIDILNLNYKTHSDKFIKNEKLKSILDKSLIYINNKGITDSKTLIESQQIRKTFLLQKKVKMDSKVNGEIKKKVGDILANLIYHKRDKYLNINNIPNNSYINNESIIEVTNAESYNLDFSDLYLQDIAIEDDCIEPKPNLDREQTAESIIPDYSELPFIDTNQQIKLTEYLETVPYWPHTYIYSVHDLRNTSRANQKFYKKFKEAFYKGVFYDLKYNSNYYFSLLFDLLNEYEKHKNISRLENQFYILSKCYPETMTYVVSNLLKLLNKKDYLHISTLVEQYPDYHWELGDKYARRLNLSKNEIKILNNFTHTSINFNSIEKCQYEIVKLFLYAIRKWKINRLKQEIEAFANIIIEKYSTSERYIPSADYIKKDIFKSIYKYCEHHIRIQYGVRQKVYFYIWYYTDELNKLIDESILTPLESIISTYNVISPPDEACEIQLNLISPTRWRDSYKKLIDQYNGNIELLINGLNDIHHLNKKNINIKHMYYETIKLVFSSNLALALKLYIEYITINMQDTEDAKEKILPKYICKKIFTTIKQQNEFEVIIKKYKDDKDKTKAYSAIDELFLSKRKKISLDSLEISKITEQYSDTVKLLNKVMEDDPLILVEQRPLIDKVQDNIINSCNLRTKLILDSEQQELLNIFAKNDFTLKKTEAESFAKSKNLMPNRFIEKINEVCYETLDDILIEEDGDCWTVFEDYLKKILDL